MSVSGFSVRAPRQAGKALAVAAALVVVTVVAVAFGMEASKSHRALFDIGVPIVLTPLALWLMCSRHYERTLAVLLVYLACIDGVVKLLSASSAATLGRDVVLYSIVVGALLRLAVRREPIRVPVMGGLVIAWYAVVLVQLANPSGVSIVHSLASLRPHLEFVPLFFLAYACIRTERRLWVLLSLLVIVAAANGVAGLVESRLSPEQLGSWGPGYHGLVFGGAGGVGQTFTTSNGGSAVRPPALGGFSGFGGGVGEYALVAGLALLAGSRSSRGLPMPRLVTAILAALAIVAVLTSQSRSALLSTFIGLMAFLLLTVTSREGLRAVAGVAVGLAVAFVLYSSVVPSGANRYSGNACAGNCSVAPSQLVSTLSHTLTVHGTLSLVPKYLVDYPLGAGLGRTGAGAGSSIGASESAGTQALNGESEFTYLIIETGIPGLLVMLALNVALLRAIWKLRSIADSSIQRPLMALGAVVFIMVCSWPFGAFTAAPPASPMFWAAAGTLAYWIGEVKRGRLAMSRKLVERFAR